MSGLGIAGCTDVILHSRIDAHAFAGLPELRYLGRITGVAVPEHGMHLGHQGVKEARRDRGRGHAQPVMPVVGLVERAGGNAIAARAVILDPEIEALLGVGIKLLHPGMVVPGIAGLVTVLVGGLEAETAVHAVDQGYRSSRAGLGTLPAAQAELRHAPVVGLVVFDELDMQREAANASILRRNFKNSKDLYIPEVYWQWCTHRVMVMERVSGLPVGDIENLKKHGVNLKKLARRGVRVFYTQVFRDNLFHADLHPGNILVDASDPDEPTYIAMDFGIVASLSAEDLYYIAENFKALFNQDYRRVAALHIDAGWVPEDTRLVELEAAVRSVGEPNFTRPLNEVSFGKVLFDLFQVAHRFQLTLQPQLLMLQKTLLNVEGLARQLDPELDIWGVAKPELETILREKHNLENVSHEMRERLPGWLAQAPEIPGLVHDFLVKANNGQLLTRTASEDAAKSRQEQRTSSHKVLQVLAGGSLSIPGAILTAMETGPWFLWGYSVPGMAFLAVGGWLIFRALRQ